MPNVISLTERQLYCLGAEGTVRAYFPNWTPVLIQNKSYHVEGTDFDVIVEDITTVNVESVSLDDLFAAGFRAYIPSICRNTSPTKKQKDAYAAMTELQKDEYIRTKARHTYIGWCDVADKVFKAFTEDWKERFPDNADALDNSNGLIQCAVFKFKDFH